jgi:hypothetical protein
MGFPNNKITNGLSGGQHISTSSASGDWIAIQVLADAKFRHHLHAGQRRDLL